MGLKTPVWHRERGQLASTDPAMGEKKVNYPSHLKGTTMTVQPKAMWCKQGIPHTTAELGSREHAENTFHPRITTREGLRHLVGQS